MLRSARSKFVNPLRIQGARRNLANAPKPWQRHAWLDRIPKARPSEKLQHGAGDVVQHPTEPVFSGRGKEHVITVDVDYMHVTPEDEKVGLVITGLHPKTRVKDLRSFLARNTVVRHCWIHKEGMACVRFQDEECKEKARLLLEKNKTYQYHIYNEDRRNWLGDAPPDTAPVRSLPLTTQYDREDCAPGRVLVMRSVIALREATLTLFRQYGDLGLGRPGSVRIVWTRFYAHDKWIWEYYIQFHTVEAASRALSELHQQKVFIPARHLSTVDKILNPHGKTFHLWLRHTGLDKLPREGTQDTVLQRVLYKSDDISSSQD